MKVIATILISSLIIFLTPDNLYFPAFGSVKKVVATDSLNLTIQQQSRPHHLSLVLSPLKKLSSSPADLEELTCFLINNTDTTTLVSREDDTISKLQSEIFIKNKWILFQYSSGSDCGNSYWKQKLNAKHSFVINFGWKYAGKVKLPLRLVYNHQGKTIYSNNIQVMISRDAFKYMKQSKLPLKS
jgi:hypothetical protein